MAKAMKTYSYKLYHSNRNKKLHKIIDNCSRIWNYCITMHRRYYRLYKKSLRANDLKKHIAKVKKVGMFKDIEDSFFDNLKKNRFLFLKEFDAQSTQDIVERIDRAYEKFFADRKKKKKVSPPKYRPRRKYKSFTLKKNGWKHLEGNVIKIFKKKYRYFKHREMADGDKIKTVTIKRDALGDIYIFFTCETQKPEVLAKLGKSIGFDFGLKKFLTSSENQDCDIVAPLFFKQNANAIANANRKLSRKRKGSNHYVRAKLALARLHKKTANQRENFHWEVAHHLVSQYSLICIEDLNIKAMQKRWGRKISDLAFYDFVKKLDYMATKTGASVQRVDRFFASSQICSDCGYQNQDVKNLKIREWVCPQCGAKHDRDRNAAKNILARGIELDATLKA